MTRYAIRLRDGTILVRRMGDDQEIARFTAQGDRDIWVFALSPDGRYLATTNPPIGVLTVWDIERRAIALNVPGDWWARFSPDSQRIAVEHERKILVYDLAASKVSRNWGGAAPGGSPVFRPDGARIAVFHRDQKNDTCRILDADTGRLVRSIPLPTPGKGAAWSPDGTTLATPCDDWKIYALGHRYRHPAGDPRGLYQFGHHYRFPPRRHGTGQQRLGRPIEALGSGPGPAGFEHDRRPGAQLQPGWPDLRWLG